MMLPRRWLGLVPAVALAGALAPAGAATAASTPLQTLQASFPGVATVAPSGGPAAALAPGDRVVGYAADNVARVVGPRGRRLLLSTRPLRTLDGRGTVAPVDLSLRADGARALEPANAPLHLSIDRTPAAGFTIGPDAAHSVHVAPIDADPSAEAAPTAGQLFAPDTQAATDTLLRPTVNGLETYQQLRSERAPERFDYRVDLGPGQAMTQSRGRVLVTQDGRALLAITAPLAVDARGRSVPIALAASGRTLTMIVEHRGGDYAYPILADPEWDSQYDWSERAGVGPEGWFVDPSSDLDYYAPFLLTEPVAPDMRDGDGFNNHVGLFITPRGGQVFPEGKSAALLFRAPGTTTISSVAFRDVDEVNDRDRQTIRLRLTKPGSAGVSDDYFEASPTGVQRPLIFLQSPQQDATFVIVSMFTPPCTASELENMICPRFVPVDHGSVVKVGSVDISLLDSDFPTATASGALRALADTWTQGSDPSSVDLRFADGGAGVSDWRLQSTDEAGTHAITASGPLCDGDHNTPDQGSNVCPAATTQAGIVVDVPRLPEGQNRFAATATDLAGNTSDGGSGSDRWSVFIDRSRPTLTASGPLHDAADTWVDPDEVPFDLHLSAHDARSGIQHDDVTVTDERGATLTTSTSDACTPAGPPGQPCPNDYANDVTIDRDTVPEGELSFEATATDHVGLQSDPARWTLRLDRTPPVARARGELVGLQDRWTNETDAVAATVDARDRLSGVSRVDLVAVNADGRRVIGSASVCDAGDKDPADGSCPHTVARSIPVDAGDLPDGLNHFEVQAHDLAGHTSRREDTWDTYVDHTAPPKPTGVTVTGNSPTTAEIHWNPVVDVPEGADGVSYEYLVLDHGTALTQWTSTPYPKAIVPGLPPGVNLTVLVRAIDKADNASDTGEGDGALLRAASAAGESLDVQLARNFRPQWLFDTSEHFRPLDMESFFRDSRPRIKECAPLSGCTEQLSLHDAMKKTVETPTFRRQETYFDTPGRQGHTDDYTGDDDRVSRRAYYHVSLTPAYRIIDYWVYYRYNHAPYHFLFDDEHEGDWEGLTVVLPRGRHPSTFAFVAFAEHAGRYRYLPKVLRCDSGDSCGPFSKRIKAYVASGTHATYPSPCQAGFTLNGAVYQNHLCAQTASSSIPAFGVKNLPEGGFDGDKPWGSNGDRTAVSPLPRFDPTYRGAFTNWPGNWNSSEIGVQSPGLQKRFRTPLAVTCTDRTYFGNHNRDPYTDCAGNRIEAKDVRAAPALGAFGAADPLAPDDEITQANATNLDQPADEVPLDAPGEDGGCAPWSGSFVTISVCDADQVNAAMNAGALDQAGSFTVAAGGRPQDRVPGLTQVGGGSLAPGEAVTVSGSTETGTQLFARVADKRADAAVHFTLPSLAPGTKIRLRGMVASDGAPSATATLPDGTKLTPDGRNVAESRPRIAALRPRLIVFHARRSSGGGRAIGSIRARRASEVVIRAEDRSGVTVARTIVPVDRTLRTFQLRLPRRAVRVRATAVGATGLVSTVRTAHPR